MVACLQSLRFYGQVVVAALCGGLVSIVGVIAAAGAIGDVLSKNKTAFGVNFSWGMTSVVLISTLTSILQYTGERLALDWRRELTRRVCLWGELEAGQSDQLSAQLEARG